VKLDRQVLAEEKVPKASKGFAALSDHPDLLDPREGKDQREDQEVQGPREHRGYQELKETLDN